VLAFVFLAEIVARSGQANEVARAVVRIERSAKVDPESWMQTPAAQRREVRRIDEQGRRIILRLIEFQ
jgi:hypothetical protein